MPMSCISDTFHTASQLNQNFAGKLLSLLYGRGRVMGRDLLVAVTFAFYKFCKRVWQSSGRAEPKKVEFCKRVWQSSDRAEPKRVNSLRGCGILVVEWNPSFSPPSWPAASHVHVSSHPADQCLPVCR